VTRPSGRPFRLFEVVGLELEYPVVDRDLAPRCLVEPAFRRFHGRPTSDIEFDNVGFSNELAAHVFEIKTVEPERTLDRAERALVRGLGRFAALLRDEYGARLLPTGMHPFMRPGQTQLWPRAGRRIYRTYDRIFGVRGHGWLNVQASHVNLPFGTEEETVALHNAIACLLPYLPALAASSPIVEGRIGPYVDNRLAFYRTNQRRIPQITADVIPEFVGSFREYRTRILRPIYRLLDVVPGGDVIQHEWVNSRGAIVRFMRQAIEIRVLDVQECVRADVAIAVFVRGVLRWMVEQIRSGAMPLPPHHLLVADLGRTIRSGSLARVAAPHLPARRRGQSNTARDVLEVLLERAEHRVAATERPYLTLIAGRIRQGTLSERIAAAVRRRAPRAGQRQREAIRGVYEELAVCLEGNEVWTG
jgi:gamma-glutamyl:cysteine ligase YbdK (ATP-grasp superfamily)